MLRPVRPEGDLWHLTLDRSFGGDQLGALRRAAMQKRYIGMLGMDPVKPIPDQQMVVELKPAGQSDLGTEPQHHLGEAANGTTVFS